MTRHLLTAALALIVLGVAVQRACAADVITPATLYLSLSAADLGSTAIARGNGASELNPWMTERAIEKQLALAGLLTLADVKLKRPGQKKALRVAVTVVRFGAIAWNVRNAGRRR